MQWWPWFADTVVLHRRCFAEYRLTNQSGRSTEIGRIVEVVLEELRTHKTCARNAYISCCVYKKCRSNSRVSVSNWKGWCRQVTLCNLTLVPVCRSQFTQCKCGRHVYLQMSPLSKQLLWIIVNRNSGKKLIILQVWLDPLQHCGAAPPPPFCATPLLFSGRGFKRARLE